MIFRTELEALRLSSVTMTDLGLVEIATAWCLSCSQQDLPACLPASPPRPPARSHSYLCSPLLREHGRNTKVNLLFKASSHAPSRAPPTDTASRTLTQRRPPGAVTCELSCLPVCSERDDVLRGLLFKLSVCFFFTSPRRRCSIHMHSLNRGKKAMLYMLMTRPGCALKTRRDVCACT